MVIKAILIDLDNTLYHYEICNQAGIGAIVDKLSVILNKPRELVRNVFEESRGKVKAQLKDTASAHSRFLYLQKTIESLKGSTDIKLTQEMHDLFWDTYFKQMKLFDGVIDFFKQLKDRKIKIVIVSDLVADLQFRKLVRLGIDNYVDFVVTSEEAGEDKPAEPMFLLTLEKLGMSKEDVVFVGDDLDRDIKGAQVIGLKYILVNDGNFKSVLESFKNLKFIE